MGLDVIFYKLKNVRKDKDESIKTLDEYIDICQEGSEDLCCLHGMNFIYKYFLSRLTNERCIVTREDILDIKERCEKIFIDSTLAEKLFPVEKEFNSGIYGPIDYGVAYFKKLKICRNEMSLLLNKFSEDKDILYVQMSW